jgi:hypothetical protein
MKTFEEFDLHQKNAPALNNGTDSRKPRKGARIYQFGQNTNDGEFDEAEGQSDGVGDGSDGSISANTAVGTGYMGSQPSLGSNVSQPGSMANTTGNKLPTKEEEDSIIVPAYNYTKKGKTGDKYTKVSYTGIKRFDDF